MDVGRKRTTSAGLPENLYVEGGRYRYRNPETGQRPWLGSDRDHAIELATKANLVLASRRLAKAAPTAITIGHGIDMYLENAVPGKPWDTGTERNARYRLAVIKAAMGDRPIATTDRVYLADWLAIRGTSGDLHNKWRAHLVDLWRYFISRKWVDYNEADATPKRSTSTKLAENRRVRQRLDLTGFWAIHDHETAEPFLQVAMELSLVLLQARAEVCTMRTSDFRDGWLYVIRDKTAGDSDMAFVRIRVNEQLEDIKRRAMSDGILTEHLVHRRSLRLRPEDRAKKPHWAAVRPEYLTRAFQEVRDATGRWAHLQPRQRPSFHEILSLGARCYRDAGFPKAYIQALKTHSDPSTTDIYLAGGELKPEHYRAVEVGLNLERLR